MKTIQQLEAENEDLRRELVVAKEGQRLWNEARTRMPAERGQWSAAVNHWKERAEDAESRLNAAIEARSIAEAGRLRYEAALESADDLFDRIECYPEDWSPSFAEAVTEWRRMYEALNPLSISGTVQG